MDENLKKALEQDMKENARKHIKKAMRKWGIERTEEQIKRLYQCSPKLRDFMLNEYFFLIGLDKR